MVSIIVSWRDRNELGTALPFLSASALQVGGEVIIVNFSGDACLLETLLKGDYRNLKLVTVLGQQYFNKAAAQNMGAAHAEYPLLFFCD
jgi:hypothetical protein